ncbi:MAG: exonuclease domain-containing protein [Succinivibrio sp.]
MSIISSFSTIEKYKRRCLKFAKSKWCPENLKEFYTRELPDADSYVDECRFTSIDFETTGLNPNDDYVLSIGGISLCHGVIDFTTSFHFYVNNSKYIKKDSAVINQITPEQLLDGKDPIIAMTELLDRIAGGIVLMHCKFIETSFIRSTLGLKSRDPLPFISLDTMSIETWLQRTQTYKDVRLAAIREKRGLPSYESHNALIDSLSTAEVFLAQEKDIFKNKRPTLLPLYKRSL